jgi:hypothetical protein
MIQFSWGALTMACAIIGLFLLKFWRQSADRLFVFFAVAFWTLGLHWFLLAYVNPGVESRHELYLLRLAAFVTIIVGVVDKNARAAKLAAANGKRP